MPFLLGNLFCAVHRKSSGKKDAQGCGEGKEMVALQFRQAGQTNCGKHQVTKKRSVKKMARNQKRKT